MRKWPAEVFLFCRNLKYDLCIHSTTNFLYLFQYKWAFVCTQIQILPLHPNLFQFENRTDFDGKKEGIKYNNYCVSSNTIIRDLEITNARICDFKITKNSNSQNYIECFHLWFFKFLEFFGLHIKLQIEKMASGGVFVL